MKIAKITAAAWDVPMRYPFRSAQRVTTTARNVLVTVTMAESSAIGYGESAPATYVTGETQDSVVAALQSVIADISGNLPISSDELLSRAAVRLQGFPGAFSALMMAAYDAMAREAGLPLFRLLREGIGGQGAIVTGNAAITTERATDLSLPILNPDEARIRAAQAASDGFQAIKIKVGSGSSLDDELSVRAIAEAAPRATLRLDGNQGFTGPQAVDFVGRLGDLIPRIEMFEQPTKAHDNDAMAFVATRIPVPVFADESVHSPDEAQMLVESGVCGGVVLKLAKSDLATVAQIAERTYKAGGRCMFGCMMESHIAVTAALHLTAALGADIVPMLDLDGHLLTKDDGLVEGGLTQTADMLKIDAKAPGLGVTVLGA